MSTPSRGKRLERRAAGRCAPAGRRPPGSKPVSTRTSRRPAQDPEVVGHLDLGVGLAVALVAVEELALARPQAAVADRGDLVARRPRRPPALLPQRPACATPRLRDTSRRPTPRRAGRSRCGRRRRRRVPRRASRAAGRARRGASATPWRAPRPGRARRPSAISLSRKPEPKRASEDLLRELVGGRACCGRCRR